MTTREKRPAANDQNWLGNTATKAFLKEIGSDDRWHTLGQCMDTPNAIAAELTKEQYLGHCVWIFDQFGNKSYHGTVKKGA